MSTPVARRIVPPPAPPPKMLSLEDFHDLNPHVAVKDSLSSSAPAQERSFILWIWDGVCNFFTSLFSCFHLFSSAPDSEKPPQEAKEKEAVSETPPQEPQRETSWAPFHLISPSANQRVSDVAIRVSRDVENPERLRFILDVWREDHGWQLNESEKYTTLLTLFQHQDFSQFLAAMRKFCERKGYEPSFILDCSYPAFSQDQRRELMSSALEAGFWFLDDQIFDMGEVPLYSMEEIQEITGKIKPIQKKKEPKDIELPLTRAKTILAYHLNEPVEQITNDRVKTEWFWGLAAVPKSASRSEVFLARHRLQMSFQGHKGRLEQPLILGLQDFTNKKSEKGTLLLLDASTELA